MGSFPSCTAPAKCTPPVKLVALILSAVLLMQLQTFQYLVPTLSSVGLRSLGCQCTLPPVLSVLVLFGSWLSAPFRLSYPLLVLIQCRTFLSHDHIPHPFKVRCSITVLFAKVTELPTFGSNKQSLSGTFNRLALPLIRAPLHALILRTAPKLSVKIYAALVDTLP